MLFFQFCNIFKFRLFINVDHPFNMGSIQSKSFKRQLLNQQANAAAKIWGYPKDGVYKDCIRFWNFNSEIQNSILKFNFKLEYRSVGWQLCQALGASKTCNRLTGYDTSRVPLFICMLVFLWSPISALICLLRLASSFIFFLLFVYSFRDQKHTLLHGVKRIAQTVLQRNVWWLGESPVTK